MTRICFDIEFYLLTLIEEVTTSLLQFPALSFNFTVNFVDSVESLPNINIPESLIVSSPSICRFWSGGVSGFTWYSSALGNLESFT